MLDTLPKFQLGGEPHVVLLDAAGRPSGSASKATVHDEQTPLHLAFSCHVVGSDGRWLLTRRAASKRTFPGVWSNACCGHPQPGETLRQAVTRHLASELELTPREMTLALGDFAYRAVASDGTVEHELCPVVIVAVEGEPVPQPDEADSVEWVQWDDLVDRSRRPDTPLSPWSVQQLGRLAEGGDPAELLIRHDPADRLLDVAPGTRVPQLREPSAAGAAVQAMIDQRLADVVAAKADDVPDDGGAIAALCSAIGSLTAAGGKRLRPAFVMWGNAAAGGAVDASSTLDAAAAVELLHTFALLHDDVMDRSTTRRGRPTAQHAFRDLGSRTADPEWFGLSAAILAGDLAFVWADELFDASEDGADPAAHRAARRMFTLLRKEVIAGQYLDVHTGCSPTAVEADAARIALLKSARYTVTRPLQIGAALAGASPELNDAVGRYGDATGMAFQLRDDVLGLFGDPQHTGKSCIDDLREGKRTLLVVRAMEMTSAAGQEVLTAALGRADLDELSAQRCRDVVAESGALASVEAAIEVHLQRALAEASAFEHGAAGPLTELAEMAARRDR